MRIAEVKESFMMAMSALAAHKLRSALTLLGVLVGVFSIIITMTAMRALQRTMESELSQLGAHTFVVQKWPGIMVASGPEEWEKYWRRKNLRYSLGLQLKERATLARQVGVSAGLWNDQVISRFEKTNPNVTLFGVTPEVFEARNWIVDEGRALLASDIDSARYVCVLGFRLAKKLFPRGSALNEKVKFNGVNYAVVGVLASKGGMVDGDQDNFLAIPLTTGLNRYSRDRSLSILVQARSQETYDDTVEQVRGILRTLRKVPPGKEDDFDIVSNDSLVQQFKTITLAVRVGVTAVSSIALLAAGIGIMNIMLVSVTERTREIGIRRAIGAKKRSIMTQFIMESIAICEVGGVVGVVLGVLGGNLAAHFLKVPPVIPIDWVVLGLAICSLVGIVFGTYPAYKAANLDPIESLRYE
jgi:putative ABC transport system permease protein